VVPSFFLKLLALEGVRPMIEQCAGCGEDAELVAFSDLDGGALCQACRRGTAISPEALELMRLVLGGRLGQALATPPSAATHEVQVLATAALEHHLERRLRSVHVL
jgi:DNA repair protein RecO (recombination protein O)